MDKTDIILLIILVILAGLTICMGIMTGIKNPRSEEPVQLITFSERFYNQIPVSICP